MIHASNFKADSEHARALILAHEEQAIQFVSLFIPHKGGERRMQQHDNRDQTQTNKLKIGSLSCPPLDPLPLLARQIYDKLFINDTIVETILYLSHFGYVVIQASEKWAAPQSHK